MNLLENASPDTIALNPQLFTTQKRQRPLPAKRHKPNDPEHQMQVALFNEIDRLTADIPDLALAFAVPNGGHRNKATAAKLKAEGQRAGVPDVLLLHPSFDGRYHGLAMELKIKPNKPTNQQTEWLQRLDNAGYYTVVVYDDYRTAVRELIYFLTGQG